MTLQTISFLSTWIYENRTKKEILKVTIRSLNMNDIMNHNIRPNITCIRKLFVLYDGNNAASYYHRTHMFSDFDISVTSCEF